MMFPRNQAIRSPRLRQSAHGAPCTFNIHGVCNNDRSTSVLCHLPDESKGTGRKSDDIVAAIGCSDCHDVIDGRAGYLPPIDREWYMRRAQIRTLRYWIDQGLVRIK